MRPEFSKIILCAVMLTFEAAALYGAVIVWEERALLPEYLTFVGAPTAVAVGFYAWKAKAENMLKIARSQGKKATKEYIAKVREKLKEMEEEDADR